MVINYNKEISKVLNEYNKFFELIKISNHENYLMIGLNINKLLGVFLDFNDICFTMEKIYNFILFNTDLNKCFKKIELNKTKILLYKF